MALLDPAKAAAFETPPAAPPAPVRAPRTERDRDLEAIEVSEELALLYKDARDLLDFVLSDGETPANQKAQVLNSTHALIERITKTRTDLYNSERIRLIEQVILRVMADQPQTIKEEFIRQYEAALGSA